MLRIGQDLLGDFVGKRELGFSMFLKDSNKLEIVPIMNAGYRAIYYGRSRSPHVSILMFYRQCRAKPPVAGLYNAKMSFTDESTLVITIDFSEKGRIE